MESREGPAECLEIAPALHDLRRGRLDPARRQAVIGHLRTCASCRRLDEEEALLDRLLVERLPRPEPSAELRARIEAICSGADAAPVPLPVRPGGGRDPRRVRRRWVSPALAAAAALLVGVGIGEMRRREGVASDPGAALVAEAIGDHLRSLTAAHPLDVQSDDSHNVKPWFEGRIDFAPNVPGSGGSLRLRGGSVGYFLGRKAAVVSYSIRQHAVTLLAFPATDLPWPGTNRTLAGVPVHVETERGIHTVLWRHGDVGYAAVADVGLPEFLDTAGRLARETGDAPARP